MIGLEWARRAGSWLNPLMWPWWSLLLISVLLALAAWGVQATLDVNRASGYTRATLTFSDNQGNLLLMVEYPSELRVGTSDELPRPMFLTLSRVGAAAVTPTPIASTKSAASESPQAAYIVSFLSNKPGILFVNSSRESLPLQVPLGPKLPAAEAVYLQRSPPLDAAPPLYPPHLITFAVQLYAPSGELLTPASSMGKPELGIRLESKAMASWRRFLELVFGPATPLLALAGAVAAYGLGRWEKRRRKELEDRLAELNKVDPKAPRAAYQLYDKLRRHLKGDPELEKQLNEHWATACHEELQRELLRLAANGLIDNALENARGIVEAVQATGSKLKAMNWLAQAIEVERKAQSGSPPPEAASTPEAQAMLYLRLYHAIDTLRGWVCQRLLELAKSSDEGLDAVFDLRSEPLALGLLNRVSFMQLLDARVKRVLDDKERTRLERIKQDLEIRPEPLSPWAKTSPPTDPGVQRWLMEQGLHMDPFRASSAEQEPELKRMLYKHPCFTEVVRPGSNVLLGQAGTGKTTARLFFEQHCYQAGPAVWFPVRYELLPEKSDQSLTGTIVAAFGEALIPYIVRNPHKLTGLEREPRATVVSVLLAGTGSLKGLEETLRVIAFSELPEASYSLMLDMLRDAANSSVSADELQDTTLVALMERVARHLGFEHLYLLVDGLEGRLSRAPSRITGWLEALLDNAPRWADHRIYLKLFLPTEAEKQLPGLSDLDSCYLIWEPGQLLELLRQRLRVASDDTIDSLQALTDPSVARPDEQLVEAAKGLPRQLIRLGCQLLSVHVRKRPELDSLTAEDFREALASG